MSNEIRSFFNGGSVVNPVVVHDQDSLVVPDDFKVVALLAARNEVDIITSSVGDLVEQGIEVYLIDDNSSDGTVEAVSALRGKGLLGVESRPQTSSEIFALKELMLRKEELAESLDAVWFINHDADEFREGPWSGLDLRQAIFLVDQLGFNAIDFEVLDFWPTHDDFKAGDDPREAFPFFASSAAANKLQIRCWKKLPGSLDLVSSGGHEAIFAGRKVFPIRFLLRHYPFRGQAHGERKLFGDRRPRYAAGEVENGWHLQHDVLKEGESFIRKPEALEVFDPLQARLNLWLHNRVVEERTNDPQAARLREEGLAREAESLSQDLNERNINLIDLHRQLDERNREAEELSRNLDASNRRMEGLHQDLDGRNREVADLHGQLDARNHEIEGLHQDLESRNHELVNLHEKLDAGNHEIDTLKIELQSRGQRFDGALRENADLRNSLDQQAEGRQALEETLEAVRQSWSWRVTVPLRAILKWLRGR